MARILRATVVLALLLAVPAGRAAADSTADARALFQRAEMSFNLGKFAQALADYQAAYEAKPLPAFLFNIAQCYRNMASYERARFFYRRFLAIEPRGPNRRLVEDLIAEMTQLLAQQQRAAGPAMVPNAAALTTPPALAVSSSSPLATGPGSYPERSPALLTARAPEQEGPPVYKRWWFWTGAGAVVAGGVVAAVLLTRDGGPHGSLAPIDGR